VGIILKRNENAGGLFKRVEQVSNRSKKYNRINGIVSGSASFLPQSAGLMGHGMGSAQELAPKPLSGAVYLKLPAPFQETFRPCPLLPQR
jgi:hypothetical protein